MSSSAKWKGALCNALWLGPAFAVLMVIVFARAPHRKQKDSLFVSDGLGYYMYLPSLFIDGDLDFTNEIARQPEQERHTFYQIVPQTGLPGNGFQVGCALVWLPFFLVTHGAVTGLRALGMDLPADGFGLAYELPVYCGSFAFGLVGLFYMRRLLAELWGGSVATAATVALTLATAVAAYLWFEPDMSHIVSMSLIAMLFYYLHRIHRENSLGWVAWARVGVLTGLVLSVRAPDALVGIVVAGVGLSVCRKVSSARAAAPWGEMARAVLSFAVAATVVSIPQMVVWKTLYDTYITIPANSNYDRTNWLEPDALNYLFSSTRGIFVWTPLLLVAAVGLVAGLRRGPVVLQLGVLVLIAAVYFNSSIFRWWTGCSFGERRLVDYAVIFALGLGYLMSLRPRWATHWATCLVLLALCAFNWVLMVRYFTHDLPEYGHVSLNNLYVGTVEFASRFLARFFL